jgi:hypothetical protein
MFNSKIIIMKFKHFKIQDKDDEFLFVLGDLLIGRLLYTKTSMDSIVLNNIKVYHNKQTGLSTKILESFFKKKIEEGYVNFSANSVFSVIYARTLVKHFGFDAVNKLKQNQIFVDKYSATKLSIYNASNNAKDILLRSIESNLFHFVSVPPHNSLELFIPDEYILTDINVLIKILGL